jgi:hypothetical protein
MGRAVHVALLPSYGFPMTLKDLYYLFSTVSYNFLMNNFGFACKNLEA